MNREATQDINEAYKARVEETADYIKSQCAIEVKKAVILGTGLGHFTNLLDDVIFKIPYSEIVGFPESTVKGHSGELIFGQTQGIPLCILSGRFHYYEGYDMKDLTLPIRVLKYLGVEELYITNVSGSVNPDFNEGDIVLVKDHINMMPDNPLRGPNVDAWGPRFPDFSEVYSSRLSKIAGLISKELGLDLKSGVYYALQGPNLETPAEYKMIHLLGADLVGMSTVPEVIVAKHSGMEIMVLSMVSNQCFPVEDIKETTIDSVLQLAQEKGPDLSKLLIKILNHEPNSF